MSSELFISVIDVLQRPLFKSTKVVAGKNGLQKRIRWVHVLEIDNFDSLIHGQEMILTTGTSFQSDKLAFLSYLKKLIDLQASCLCLEMGRYFKSYPDEMIALADQYDFPLLVITENVRFVDITQDLHSLIINRHHQMLQNLEKISREFHRLVLTSQGTSNVLKLLSSSTKHQVIYLPLQGQASFLPHTQGNHQKELLDFLNDRLNEIPSHEPTHVPYEYRLRDKLLLLQPVGAMGQTWAYIALISVQAITEYDYLILDSASISIAQDLLRKRYVEERKLHSENVWVDDLLHNRIHDDEQLLTIMGSDFKKYKQKSLRVCVIEMDNVQDLDTSEDTFESLQFHLSLLIRSTFEQYAFKPFIHVNKHQIVIVGLDLETKSSSKEKWQQVLSSIQNMNQVNNSKGIQMRFGIGQAYTQFRQAHLSYQEALKALLLYPIYQKPILYYEQIGVFQLLINLREGNTLESFIHNQIGSLIAEDENKGSSLLKTLKVYLDCNGSKELAAQKLFIVRQTLYYRLEKIKELLGEDFLSTENRLGLEVALLAFQMLHPDNT